MEDRELRDKTLKLGSIARAAGIFGVDKIIIFKDPVETSVDDSSMIVEILRYIETPPYLRKKLYPLKPRLAYVGLLPPLKIPSHKPSVGMKGLTDGETREAIVEEFRGSLAADVGVEAPIPLDHSARPGSRITAVIHRSGRDLSCAPLERSLVKGYWGFEVKEQKQLEPLLDDGRISLVIATSRKGTSIIDVWTQLTSAIRRGGKTLLVFGAPRRGLLEMYPKEILEKKCDFILNTVPHQMTETVRTEEALLATLAVLNLAANL